MSTKPICFMSLQVSDKCEACNKCPHRAECVDGAYAFLDTWRGTATIDAERQRIALVAQQLVRSNMPKKAIEGAKPTTEPVPAPKSRIGNAAVKRASTRAEKSGKFALYARELKAGRNPGKKGWEIVFFDLLLRGNMTREKLVRTYMEDHRTAYTKGSAKTRACTAIAMFQEALFIRADEVNITIHPHLFFDTTNTPTTKPQQ